MNKIILYKHDHDPRTRCLFAGWVVGLPSRMLALRYICDAAWTPWSRDYSMAAATMPVTRSASKQKSQCDVTWKVAPPVSTTEVHSAMTDTDSPPNSPRSDALLACLAPRAAAGALRTPFADVDARRYAADAAFLIRSLYLRQDSEKLFPALDLEVPVGARRPERCEDPMHVVAGAVALFRVAVDEVELARREERAEKNRSSGT